MLLLLLVALAPLLSLRVRLSVAGTPAVCLPVTQLGLLLDEFAITARGLHHLGGSGASRSLLLNGLTFLSALNLLHLLLIIHKLLQRLRVQVLSTLRQLEG